VTSGAQAVSDFATREQRLRDRLEARFAPLELVIEDESRFHAGHAGAAGGHSHYRVRIVAEAFRGVTPVASHRLVYAALGDMLQTDIHALAIDASPPAIDASRPKVETNRGKG
jgi:BolA protein